MNQSVGTFEYIDADFILAGVKSQLGLRESTIDDAYLRDSINDGVKNLRIYGTLVPIVTQLEIDHESATPKAKLPSGFVRFVKDCPIVFVNAEGQAISGVNSQYIESIATNGGGENLGSITYPFPYANIPFSQPAFVNNTFFENSPYNQNGYGGGTVSLVDGYLYFSTNVTADFVKISFLGTNFEDGVIKIPATAELAVRFYACEQWCATQFTITGDQKYRILQQDYYMKWAKNKAKAKVIAVLPDSLEMAQINNTFKSLL